MRKYYTRGIHLSNKVGKMDTLVDSCVKRYDENVVLRPKQREALDVLAGKTRDMIVNLPVGYGKSLVYHIMPMILGEKNKVESPTVLVISPLNLIQDDQMKSLRQHSISACKLTVKGQVNVLEHGEDELGDGHDEVVYRFVSSSSISNIVNGKHQIVMCHPEAILNTDQGQELLNNTCLHSHVVGIVIDECHIIDEWGKEFRTAFSRLHTLASTFHDVPIVALSGTLSVELLQKLPKMLGQSDPVIIQETPDRPNIFLDKKEKLASVDSQKAYEEIFKPECNKLFDLKEAYPVTIMFIPMKYMSTAVSYLRKLMGHVDIYTSIYSVIYSNQDKTVMEITINELKKNNPRIRLVLSTSVSGMGFDPENVTNIVHARPPRNLSQYLQEVGRAGRRGQKSCAILHYNNNDVAKNLPGINSNMINYCKNNVKCLRAQLLSSFGFEKGVHTEGCDCCSFCKQSCSCSKCLLLGLDEELLADLSIHE